MSDQNENIVQNTDAKPNVDSVQTDPRRLTNIDWGKETPKTVDAWKALSPEEKLDWSIWHEIRVQHTFATIAILLEIVSAIGAIVLLDSSIGMSILICVAALVLAIITGVFSYFLYKALRALVAGGLVGCLLALIASIILEDDPLRTISIILAYVVSIALFGFIEAKGGMGKKIPNFPGPKEPGLIDDIKKIRKEMKQNAAMKPKKVSKSKHNGPGLGTWFNNTMKAWGDAGIINKDHYK